MSGIQNDVWEASVSIKQHRTMQELTNRGQVGRNFNMQRITGVHTGIAPPPQPRARFNAPDPAQPSTSNAAPSTSGQTPGASVETRYHIRQNRDRLLYYIEETNEGKGFIKELCYSADGRLVCSPFGRGMRLLALNQNCSELSSCVDYYKLPTTLTEVGRCMDHHQDLVVSSKFSPRHLVLVTGCLDGRIVWYQPKGGEDL